MLIYQTKYVERASHSNKRSDTRKNSGRIANASHTDMSCMQYCNIIRRAHVSDISGRTATRSTQIIYNYNAFQRKSE